MILKELTRCEEMVFMSLLNAGEELNLPEIVERANYQYKQQWKSQTVSTFLHRITEKGYAEMRRQGRTFYYYPLVTIEEYRGMRLREIVETCFKDNWRQAESYIRKIRLEEHYL